jgi:hypothetical protein
MDTDKDHFFMTHALVSNFPIGIPLPLNSNSSKTMVVVDTKKDARIKWKI